LRQPALPISPTSDEIKQEAATMETTTTPAVAKEATNSNLSSSSSLMRLRKYVQTHFGKSKNQANRLVNQGYVTINGQVVTDTARLVSDSCVVLVPFGGETTEITSSLSHETIGEPVHVVDKPNGNNVRLGGMEIAIVAEWSIPPTESLPQSTQPLNAPISIVVAWKPVGLRTLGHFGKHGGKTTGASETLESLVSFKLGKAYYSWTRLDTGCSGVCMLSPTPPPSSNLPGLRLQHHLTFLVHGRAPDNWRQGTIIDLPIHYVQRWSKRRRAEPTSSKEKRDTAESESRMTCNDVGGMRHCQDASNESEPGHSIEAESSSIHSQGDEPDHHENNSLQQPESEIEIPNETPKSLKVHIKLLEETTDPSAPVLSTIRLETGLTVSGIANLICFSMRHNFGLRVVGDRFSRREDSQLLPRSIRNRIKQKLCMSCTHVGISSCLSTEGSEQEHEYSSPIPDKWRASFWQAFLQNTD